MLLAFLIAWLSGLSLPERAQRMAQLYFEAVCQLILDEHGQPHPALSRTDRLRAEAGIRCAHSFLDIAIWLEACAAAGLPRPRDLQPEPYAFARHAPSGDALLKRVTEFVHRWKRVRLAVRRRAQQMSAFPLRLACSASDPPPPPSAVEANTAALLPPPPEAGEVAAARLHAADGGGKPRAPP